MEKSSPEGFTGRPGSLLCIYSKKRHLSPGEDGASVCAKEPDFCELLTDKKTSGRLGASQFSGENPSSAACAWKPCAAGVLCSFPHPCHGSRRKACVHRIPWDQGPRMSKYKGGLPAAHSPFTCRLLWAALRHDLERPIKTSQAPSDAGLWFSKSLERGF